MGNAEYNKRYAKEQYDLFRVEKDELSASLFGGKCYLCGSTEDFEHYHLHHYVYHPEDSSYRRTSKAQWTRQLRLEEAQAHPERFKLMCPRCHRLITTVGTYMLRRLYPILQEIDYVKFRDLVFHELDNRLNDIEHYYS